MPSTIMLYNCKVCLCMRLPVECQDFTTIPSFVSLVFSFASYLFFFQRCLSRIHFSSLSMCLSHSYFCGFVCENEQIMKILFPRQVDVMKRLIPVMMGLHSVSL